MTTTNDIPSREYLKKVLSYYPESGKFYWKKRSKEMFQDKKLSSDVLQKRWNAKYAGKEAFFGTMKSGYKKGFLNGKFYLAHRVAWVMEKGTNPPSIIDHINGDPSDNRICNLRAASRSQNAANSKIRKDSTTGLKGVSWHPQSKKWRARISSGKIRKCLGLFDSVEDAHLAYCDAAKKTNGSFWNNGGSK